MIDPNDDWFDELALDPHAHPVAMGTRSLGDRPWLIADADRERDLDLKRDLLANSRDQVLHTTADSTEAATMLADMVAAPGGADVPAIERAALAVQEDLCLLQRRPDGWFLDASCLCFPTRWRLTEKTGLHMAAVHAPVGGYDPLITTKVDRLFDQLTDRPVWRRNWFLMADPALYQPDRPERETIIGRDQIRDELYIRSERQTLCVVTAGWIVFTIRIQQQLLGDLLTTQDRTDRFANWVANVSGDFGARRHLTEPQRTELLAGLANQ